jgi:phenylacetate-coenzyme A ligase PaaK-like adenylate-forming protein
MNLAEQVTKIRNALLPATIEFAINNFPYYREILGECHQKIKTIEDLKYIPILDKQTLIARQQDLLWDPRPDDSLVFTTGTTSKVGLLMRRSAAELNEIKKCSVLANKHTRSETHDQPLILELSEDFHGVVQNTSASGTNIICVPVSREIHYYWLIQLLSTDFNQPGVQSRISIIRSNISTFYYFTLYLIQNKIRPSDYQIKGVALTGHYLSENLRTFLEEQWQVTVTDSYSLSEFALNGTVTSEHAGYQYFILPTLIPEVVHPATHEPLESGLGALVLTSLYPFAQRQPLLRYWTGDLVERGPKSSFDAVIFKLKGRLIQSLILTEGDQIIPLIMPFDVQDILGWLPDIHRSREHHSLKRVWFLDPELTRMTLPLPVRYSLENQGSDQHTIRFEIELNYMPELFPSRLNELRSYITSELCRRNRALTQAMSEKRVEMEFHFFPPKETLPLLRI